VPGKFFTSNDTSFYCGSTQGGKTRIFLEGLINQPDFSHALDNLVPEYREQFSLPEIHQLGLVVADVEKATLYLELQGVAPFFIATGFLR